MGMDRSGVFLMTALGSGLITVFMAFFARYPVELTTGMGMNTFIAFSIAQALNLTWQQTMVILTVSGFFYFILTITPVRIWLIKSLPQGIKCAVQAGLGAFLLLVALKKGGLVTVGSTGFLKMGDFSSPSVILSFCGLLLALGLTAVKNIKISRLAAPLAILATALAGIIISEILIGTGHQDLVGTYNLPLPPWQDGSQWGGGGFIKVIFYGQLDPDNTLAFGDLLSSVFTNAKSYTAIVAILLINIFETTSSYLAVGRECGYIDPETGAMNEGGKRALIPDGISALLAGPCGTSTMTCFAESNIGIAMGAKTGLTALTAGILFLLTAFLYPVFSVFSYPCVTAPAVASVGLMILRSGLSKLDLKDTPLAYSGLLMVFAMAFTYSLSAGMGLGIAAYIVMMLSARRGKELSPVLYVLGVIFLADFVLESIL
jgi:AGZA family xanthine/uracil permease-like MFS transporter